MDTKFFIFLLVGYLFVWLGMKFPPLSESKIVIVKRIWTCTLCSGCYVFTFFAFVFGIDEVLIGIKTGILPIDYAIVGCVSSFIAHIFTIGWDTKFSIIEIK